MCRVRTSQPSEILRTDISEVKNYYNETRHTKCNFKIRSIQHNYTLNTLLLCQQGTQGLPVTCLAKQGGTVIDSIVNERDWKLRSRLQNFIYYTIYGTV